MVPEASRRSRFPGLCSHSASAVCRPRPLRWAPAPLHAVIGSPLMMAEAADCTAIRVLVTHHFCCRCSRCDSTANLIRLALVSQQQGGLNPSQRHAPQGHASQSARGPLEAASLSSSSRNPRVSAAATYCSPATDSAVQPQCDSRVQSGARVPGDDARPESAGAAAQRGRARPKRRRGALTADVCQQRSAVAVGRASRAWLAVWSVAVRGRSVARARVHAAPHGRRAEAEVVARRARSAIASCQRVCPRASSGCTITHAC